MSELQIPKKRGGHDLQARLARSRDASAELARKTEQADIDEDFPASIEHRIMQCVDGDTECSLVLEEVHQRLRNREISHEQYLREREPVVEKRRVFNDQEIALRNNRNIMMDEIDEGPATRKYSRVSDLVSMMLTEQLEKRWQPHEERGLRKNIKSWRNYLAEYYSRCTRTLLLPEESAGQLRPEDLTQWWCPILAEWIDTDSIRAARIVPRSVHDRYVESLFAEYDATTFIMSARNGILLHKSLEDAFNRGVFVLEPTGTGKGEPVNYKVRVIKHEYLETKGGKRTMACCLRSVHEKSGVVRLSTVAWSALDNRTLTWPDTVTQRPARRCLYHHALTSILFAKEKGWPGWEDSVQDLCERKIWAERGEYLSRPLLSLLWEKTMDEAVPGAVLRHAFADPYVRDGRVGVLLWWRAAEERMGEEMGRSKRAAVDESERSGEDDGEASEVDDDVDERFW